MIEPQDREALVAWLAWQHAMGVDAAVDAAATDWLLRGPAVPGQDLTFETEPSVPAVVPASMSIATPATPAARVAPATPSRQAPPSAPPPTAARPGPVAPAPRQFPTAAPDAAEASARSLAKQAASLADLQSLLAGFDGCGLKATAKNLCFYRGAGKARLMLIGEAPGRDEDLEGRPFVGPAGKLLDKMLLAGGLADADIHITNAVYWRPPGNRTPTLQEVQVCRPFLQRQIELVAPAIIVLLGGAAAKAVLDISEGIMKVRGKWQDAVIGGHKARALATLHPAFLLRTPAAKRLVWRDILAIREALDGA